MRRWTAVAAVLALSACQADKAQQERAREETVVLTANAIDCTGNLNEAERLVCSDADLRAMDRQVAELWTEVQPLTGRPNTLARRHAQWMADRDAGQRNWDTDAFQPRTADELREFYQSHIDTLTEERRLAQAIPAVSPVSALAGGCIGTALEGCTAPAAGYVTGEDGRRLAWQVQEGSTTYAGASAGIILFAVDADRLTPVGWTFDGASFEAPVMFRTGDGVFVAARGWHQGTGHGNADILLRLDGDAWTEIEIEGWRTALDERLPEGLGAWKGVGYRWPEMMAQTSLWRDGDANCCPTGGEADIDLSVSGTSLRLAGLDVRLAAPDAPAES